MADTKNAFIGKPEPVVVEEGEGEGPLLLALSALLSSAFHAVDRDEHGYRLEKGLEIDLPERVWQVLGLSVQADDRRKMPDGTWRILLRPDDNSNQHSYWKFLFPNIQPSAVIEFVSDEVNGVVHMSIPGPWLCWPWHVSSEERSAALRDARTASKQLENSIDWLDLTKASVHGGDKAALFIGVANYLSAQSRVNDTL